MRRAPSSKEVEGRLPEVVVACVGGGSNAIGIFAGFVDDPEVRLIGVEAAQAASLGSGQSRRACTAPARPVLADEDGQIADAHSISAGLDYPGVGPEHAWLRDLGRADYVTATDEEALAAFRDLTRLEGIIPALEPAHALARARELDAELVLVCLSGRGDKDLARCSLVESFRSCERADLDVPAFPTSCRWTSCWSRGPRRRGRRRHRPGVPRIPRSVERRASRRSMRRRCGSCSASNCPACARRGLLSAYVIEDTSDGKLLGGASLHHFDPLRDAVEVGYWLFVDARGRGVATRAVRQLCEHALRNGIWRVEAHVRIGNTASEKVLGRLGFEREGVKRRYLRHGADRVDATLFALLADDE